MRVEVEVDADAPFAIATAEIACVRLPGAAWTELTEIAPAIIAVVETTPRPAKNFRSFSNARLTRRDAAAALTAAGYPTATATLATLASRGGGPLFRKYGQHVLYRWGDALAWAESRLSNPVTSTSELRMFPATEATV